MLPRICFLLVFLIALPAFCQVEPSAESGSTAPEDEMPMMTPPLVSGIAYPSVAGAEVASLQLPLEHGVTGDVAAASLPVAPKYQKFTSQDELGHFLVDHYKIRTPKDLTSCEVCHR